MRCKSWFSIAGGLGWLAILFSCGCSGFSNGSGSQSPKNTYAYITEDDSAQSFTVAQFQVSNAGTLTPLAPAPVTVAFWLRSFTADSTGQFVYAVSDMNPNVPGDFQQFVVGSDGSLSPNAVPTFQGGLGTASLVSVAQCHCEIATNNGDGTISSYSVSSTGALSLVNTVPGGIGPFMAVADVTGQYVFVASYVSYDPNSPFLISEYNLAKNGTLTPMVNFEMANLPMSITVSPNGLLYYVQAPPFAGAPGSILVFSINSTNGGVSILNSIATSDGVPVWIAFDPTGSYAYVSNSDSLTVSQFKVDPANGALTSNGPDVTTGIGPTSAAVDPTGSFLLVTVQGTNNTISPQLLSFPINPDGTLGTASTSPIAAYPTSITLVQK